MKVVSLLSQKGGAGKTTIAVNLAIAAHKEGLSVAIVDIDPQASASTWSDLRDNDEPVAIPIPHTRISNAIKAATDNGADLIIIDSAPSSESATITAAKASDQVIVPCRASILDLSAIVTTLELCTAAKAKISTLVNGVKSKSLEYQAKQALSELSESSDDVDLVPLTLWDRTDYVRSLSAGLGVQEHAPSGKAADEIRRLFKWLHNNVMIT